MTSMKRRLLSLVMAMVMVCSLMPSALAEEVPELPSDADVPWEAAGNKPICTEGHGQINYTSTEATCKAGGTQIWKCITCEATKTITSDPVDHSPRTGTLTANDYVVETAKHYVKCKWCDAKADSGTTHTYDSSDHKCVCGKADPDYLTGITLSANTLTLKVGANESLTATAVPSSAPLTGIEWTSSNNAVASVSGTGKVFAEGKGEATITAAVGDITATCAVTVTEVEDEYELTITGADTVVVDKTVTLKADLKKNSEKISSEGVVWSSSSNAIATVSETGVVTGVKAGNVTITATYTVDDKEVAKDTHDIKVTKGTLSITGGKTTLTSYGDTMTLYAQFNANDLDRNAKLDWTVDGKSTSSYVDLDEKTSSVTITGKKNTPKEGVEIKATYEDDDGEKYTAVKTIHVSFSTQNAATVTVYTSTSEYYLSESDDEGGNSIEDQLDSYFSSKSSDYYGLESVEFSGKTNTYGNLTVTTGKKYYADGEEPSGNNYYSLSEAYFTPGTKSGSAIFTITANVYTTSKKVSTDEVTCTITFKVEDGTSSGDVIFYGDVGEDVPFDAASFEDFWDDNFSGGTLSYVNFSVSGGTLRDGDGKTVTSSKDCYANPKNKQVGLDDLYFEPSSANSKKATTISFSFTATGYKKGSSTTTEKKGTVSIVYMSASPKDINYSVNTSGTVDLKASDFTAAYKEATGSSAPSNLTIVFQNVPKNGTLTYTDSSKKNPSAVTLKSSNIKSRSFTTKSSGTNQIGDVTYSGKSGTDTIEYIAYSGSTPKFKGNVVFNGTAAVRQDIMVSFTSTNGQPATFSLDAFLKAEATLANATKYRFAVPNNGSLYLSGTSNAAGIDLVPTLLGSVTYRPKAGFNGSDRITFIAYDANSKMVGSGTVVVTVAGNSTTTPGGVTSASQFTDVKSDAWYFSYLSDLVSKGIITGRGNGKFDPTGTVTYGEALKMVLEATGHSAAVGTGNDWAINYKNLAVQNNWIGSDISLTAPISREATAELIAKVLGVSYSTSTSPFADTTNGYVVALYYTNPQIFIGNIVNGQRLFNTNDPLLRQEVCAIICRINDYHLSRTTNTMPDGI